MKRKAREATAPGERAQRRTWPGLIACFEVVGSSIARLVDRSLDVKRAKDPHKLVDVIGHHPLLFQGLFMLTYIRPP